MPKKPESKVEKERRIKRQKPYLSCKWYEPYGEGNGGQFCDGGCDDGLGPCRDYEEDV